MKLKLSERWIPEGSVPIYPPDGDKSLGVVYVSIHHTGRVSAIAYAGRANRHSWHYSYKSLEDVERSADGFFKGLVSHKLGVLQRRKERSKAGHEFKVGDVVGNSWGYDQTNVDWYQVIRTTPHYLKLRKIGSTVTETGFMSGNSEPKPWCYVGTDVIVRKASGTSVGFKYGSGFKWDGKPHYCSWYA